MKRSDYTPVEGLPDQYRRAINYYILGWSKGDSAEKAGFSRHMRKDIFAHPAVKAEIERRLRLTEYKTDLNKEWILNKLREIVEADPGAHFATDENGRPMLDFTKLTPEVRKLFNKFSITQEHSGKKYARTKTSVVVGISDKVNALKEMAVLLGLREEKTKVEFEQNLISQLQKRRTELAGEPETKEDD